MNFSKKSLHSIFLSVRLFGGHIWYTNGIPAVQGVLYFPDISWFIQFLSIGVIGDWVCDSQSCGHLSGGQTTIGFRIMRWACMYGQTVSLCGAIRPHPHHTCCCHIPYTLSNKYLLLSIYEDSFWREKILFGLFRLRLTQGTMKEIVWRKLHQL